MKISVPTRLNLRLKDNHKDGYQKSGQFRNGAVVLVVVAAQSETNSDQHCHQSYIKDDSPYNAQIVLIQTPLANQSS